MTKQLSCKGRLVEHQQRNQSKRAKNEKSKKCKLSVKSELPQVPKFEEKMPWCTIYYYELNQRYGDPFHGKASAFVSHTNLFSILQFIEGTVSPTFIQYSDAIPYA